MTPGPPALCRGSVWHHRLRPVGHRFQYPVSFVWVDPDRPRALTDLHWGWSTDRPGPVRVRRRDYGRSATGSLTDDIRSMLEPVVGHQPLGPVRLLTQPRRWGWLFNPISVYLVWPADERDPVNPVNPVGAVLEVTNTPWNERHLYPLPLSKNAAGDLVSEFDKQLHVSPFLGGDLRYRLEVANRDDRIDLRLDVHDRDDSVVLRTGMALERATATPRRLSMSLRRDGLSTHRVSVGIHRQALKLFTKGVRFVPHPKRSSSHGHDQR